MANINLSNQRTMVSGWFNSFQEFETALENRKPIWEKLTPEQRLKWLRMAVGTSDNPKTFQESKDPVLWIGIRLKRAIDGFDLKDID